MIHSDEWLTLETSAFESLYGGQFALWTQLIKTNYQNKTSHHITWWEKRSLIPIPEIYTGQLGWKPGIILIARPYGTTWKEKIAANIWRVNYYPKILCFRVAASDEEYVLTDLFRISGGAQVLVRTNDSISYLIRLYTSALDNWLTHPQ